MMLALVLLGEAVLGSLIIQRIACTNTHAATAAEHSGAAQQQRAE